MRANVECSPNQQNNYTFSTFPSSNQRNFEDSGKVLVVSVSEFYQSTAFELYQPTLIKWLSLMYVYEQTAFSVIRESVCVAKVISWHAFVGQLGMFSKIK